MNESNLPSDNWIYSYYQGIKDGTYAVGKWVRLVYEYIVHGLEEKLFFYNAKRASAAIAWIESHCFHTEGVLAPNPFLLAVWQKALIAIMYGIVDQNGNRQFHEVFLVVARKNGKSALATAIANYEFRIFGGFGAKVYCIAPKLEQADIVYNNLWCMIQLDPEWKAQKAVASVKDRNNRNINDSSEMARHRMTDLYIPASNSMTKKIAFNAKQSDGFNPSLTICDEVASWSGEAGLRQYEVMKSAMGSRPDGLILSCTTSGYVNDSIYDELMKRSTRFLLGDSKEKRLLPMLYMIEDADRWQDLNELRKSNPNLGVSVSVDYMLEEIAVAEGSLSKRGEFITKYCCLKQNSSVAWLSAQDVEAAYGEPFYLEEFKNSYCVGGIDLSQTTDLTSCCVVIERAGELYVFSHFFLPAEKIEDAIARDGMPYNIYIQRGLLTLSGDNFVDYHDVYNWFVRLVEEYQIFPLLTGYDRYSAQYLIQDMNTYGFHTTDVFQGENLYGIILETEGIVKDHKIHIGNNDILKSHLLNSAVKMSTERNRGKLVKISPALHIDGTAALLDAMTARQNCYAEYGEQLKNNEG